MFLKHVFSSLLAIAGPCCFGADQILTTKNAHLEVQASISTYSKKLNKGRFKLSGYIVVTNHTDAPQQYSNKALTLLLNTKYKARTYLDSVASNVIDFACVEIKSKSSASFKVYWAFDLPAPQKVDTISLNLDEGIQ